MHEQVWLSWSSRDMTWGAKLFFFTSQCSLRSLLCQKETASVGVLRQSLGGAFHALRASVVSGVQVLLDDGSRCKTKPKTITAFLFLPFGKLFQPLAVSGKVPTFL